MTVLEPQAARQFAKGVVHRLRAAGYETLWAGGCVRDHLLGRDPKDYDVATSATPDQIRQVFGRRRTLAIGAAFGVITVLGSRIEGQIEVATFRQDAAYSDGRHPDSVTFSSAEEDAKRRDFTINGMFFDPLEDRVIDYVRGQEDLSKKIIRAIGDPDERIGEDKLRMLRAARFAATFEFQIDMQTAAAIRRRASEIGVVSSERIADEMRRMLTHRNRSRALALLQELSLLAAILPDIDLRQATAESPESDSPWARTTRLLDELETCDFSTALAALLREPASSPDARVEDIVESVRRCWKLSNDEVRSTVWLLNHEAGIRAANTLPWPKIQRVLISPDAQKLVTLADAVSRVLDEPHAGIEFCREKLALPNDQLNPPPLIDGNDLLSAGIQAGPAFKELLDKTRDAQLDGRINNKDEALEFVKRIHNAP